jgi:hypothetical protein
MFLLWLLGKIPKYTIVSKSIELNKKSSIYTRDPHHNYMISNLGAKMPGKILRAAAFFWSFSK